MVHLLHRLYGVDAPGLWFTPPAVGLRNEPYPPRTVISALLGTESSHGRARRKLPRYLASRLVDLCMSLGARRPAGRVIPTCDAPTV